MYKNSTDRVEAFGRKIADLASEEGLTVAELRKATYIAKWIVNNSRIQSGISENLSLPSSHTDAEDWISGHRYPNLRERH